VARPLALVAVIAVSLLAVAGAGGAGAATQQTPKRGGTLVFAQAQAEPACLNLLLARCVAVGGIQLGSVWRLVLEAPFNLGGDLMWRPGLVASATFTTRRPFTLTYRIRSEARWSDGTPVTARDFIFTHAAILRLDESPLKTLHAEVRSIRGVGPKTVRVTLRSRVGLWRGLFTGILPAHALGRENLGEVWRDRIDNPKTGRQIGSGPFLVERWDRGRQLVLVRNPRYWGAHRAYVDRLVLRFGVQGGELASLLRSGQVHVAYNFPASFVGELRRGADLQLVAGASTGWEKLDFRIGPGGNPLLRKKLVRRAIIHGIDRGAIVSRLTAESGLPFVLLQSALFLTQSHDYRPAWRDYRYRPAESRRLLAQAGCTRGSDGIYGCGGIRLSLRFFTHLNPGSIRPGIVEQIQAQLRRVGVEVVPVFAPPSAVFGPGGVYARGTFDVALAAYIRGGLTPGTKSLFGCGADMNVTGYCQRLVTSDLDQADRIFDAGRQASALHRADARIAKDVPVVPLFQHPAYAVLAPSVRGFRLNSTNGVVGANNWWLDR
jgi:peptide/nickel transport system substrate-binding protein